MSRSTLIGKIGGIPIRVHVTLWILLPVMALSLAPQGSGRFSWIWGLLTAVGLFASVVLHELGHSMVAVAKGCRVREILLLPIGGVAQMDRMPSIPAHEFQIAIAGPLVSLLVSFALSLLYDLTAKMGWMSAALSLERLSFINLMLALFNLLPSFPMDGGRVFRAWLTPRVGRLEATRIASKTGQALAIGLGVWGLLTFNPFLIFIAVFVYFAAEAEYRAMALQATPFRGGAASGPRPLDQRDVRIGPPPYRRGWDANRWSAPIRRGRDLFDDLFENWR